MNSACYPAAFGEIKQATIKHFAKLAKSSETYNFLMPFGQKSTVKRLLANLARLFVNELNKKRLRLMYYDGQFRWRNDVMVEVINPVEFRQFVVSCLSTLNVGIPILGCADNTRKLIDNIVDLIELPEAPKNNNENEIAINLRSKVMVINDGKITLRDRGEQDFFDYVLDFDYDPTARCDKFQEFLRQTQPDSDYRDVLAEYIGTLFVPARQLNLQKMLVLKGSGNNGKSTFINIISAMVGEKNFAPISLRAMTSGKGEDAPFVIGKLLGVDSEFSGIEDPGVFKQLISAEKIRVRPLFKNPFYTDNLPRFIAACNELPSNMEQSTSMYRRLIVVPFEANFKNPDLGFAQKIIKTELAGIFKWAIDGLVRVLSREMPDINIPEVSKRYIEELRIENDAVASFVDNFAMQKSDYVSDLISTSDLYARFKDFCITNGFKLMNSNSFSRRFKNLGFKSYRTSTTRGFLVAYETNSKEPDIF